MVVFPTPRGPANRNACQMGSSESRSEGSGRSPPAPPDPQRSGGGSEAPAPGSRRRAQRKDGSRLAAALSGAGAAISGSLAGESAAAAGPAGASGSPSLATSVSFLRFPVLRFPVLRFPAPPAPRRSAAAAGQGRAERRTGSREDSSDGETSGIPGPLTWSRGDDPRRNPSQGHRLAGPAARIPPNSLW